MARTPKLPTKTQEVKTAAAIRQEMLAAGGAVPLWKLPRDIIPPSQAIFDTPLDLWNAAVSYFQWAEDNPIEYETDVRAGGQAIAVKVNKTRPFHIRAFFSFAGITFNIWKRLEGLPEFAATIEDIENTIYTQKFDHAMVGLYDAGMTSKDLGLTEKRELSGPDQGPIEVASARDVLKERLIRGTLPEGEG